MDPVRRTDDFTDVTVLGADSRRSTCQEVPAFGNEEMDRLMRRVVNRVYTYQAKADNLHS